MSFFHFDTKTVDRVDRISKADFHAAYYQRQLPLVIKDWSKHWPAHEK
jgi:hypothetical protein